MTDYKLYAVRIFSYKWEASIAFFRDVVGLPMSFSNADMGWAQFDLGGVYLGVERCDPESEEARALVGRFVGISLEVTDIKSTFEQLSAKGVVFTCAPEQQPWGGTLANFEDPDGNIFTLLGSSA